MKLRPFELTLVVIFGLLLVLAIVLLRLYKPEVSEEELLLGGPVAIWGTLPEAPMNMVIDSLKTENPGYKDVTYRFVAAEEFNQTFINALADNQSPDLVLISHELLVELRGRLEVTPYQSFPERDFRSYYIEGAGIFALKDGIYAYPIAVDPLMMYWNRDIFSFNNLLSAPKTWEEVVGETVPELTVRDFNRTITQSAVALGEYNNIKNAFATISMLLLQGGSALVAEEGKSYIVRLDQMGIGPGRPFTLAINFYSNFNSVSNTLYSWNKALALDRDVFLQDKLALYFGLGSEAKELEAKNPNLNFDIAEVPQGAGATIKRTYGRFYGVAIPKEAKNKSGAYIVRQELTSLSTAKKLADGYFMAPVYRASLGAGSNDVYGRLIYTSALQARGWLNPPRADVDSALTKLVGDVGANRSEVSGAVNDAVTRLGQAY